MMEFPKTLEAYWALPREERETLYKVHGFGHRTITQDVWFKENEVAVTGQQDLFKESN